MVNCDDIILNLEDQYMEIVHNNTRHISNVVMHILIIDMQTFFSYPYQILFGIYAYHVA